MYHLMSPPMCAAVAAQREGYLVKADLLETEADLAEHHGRAMVKAFNADKARQGRELLKKAKQCREQNQRLLAAATDLTDYDEDGQLDPAWMARAMDAAAEFRRSHYEPTTSSAWAHLRAA